jgi:hypothetical protein
MAATARFFAQNGVEAKNHIARDVARDRATYPAAGQVA